VFISREGKKNPLYATGRGDNVLCNVYCQK
jgi:hypothetical protein